MYGIIYLTVNKVNGKKYIGQHKCKTENDSYIGTGKTLKKAIEKYGRENFERHTLYKADSPEELDNMEIAFIKVFRATERNDFYNIAEGGAVNRTLKGKNNPFYGCKGPKHPCYGRKHTAEELRKMSESQKGRPWIMKDETKKKISKTMKEKNIKPQPTAYAKLKGKKGYAHAGRPHKHVLCVELGIVYESQSEIERQLGIPQANIHKVLTGERLHAGGYSFVYTESEVGAYDTKAGRNNELVVDGRTSNVLQNAS